MKDFSRLRIEREPQTIDDQLSNSKQYPLLSKAVLWSTLGIVGVVAALVIFFFSNTSSTNSKNSSSATNFSEQPDQNTSSNHNQRSAAQANSLDSLNTNLQQSDLATIVLEATGYVVAQRKAAVSSKATGRIQELLVKEGDVVAENQIIAVLENSDLRAVIAEREASIIAAQAKIKAATVEVEDSKRQLERIMTLDKWRGAIAENDRDLIADVSVKKGFSVLAPMIIAS